jgi:hypothetical protein
VSSSCPMIRPDAVVAGRRRRRSMRPRPRYPDRAAPAGARLRVASAGRRRGRWQSLRRCIAVARSPWGVCAENRCAARRSLRPSSAETVRVSHRDEQLRRGRVRPDGAGSCHRLRRAAQAWSGPGAGSRRWRHRRSARRAAGPSCPRASWTTARERPGGGPAVLRHRGVMNVGAQHDAVAHRYRDVVVHTGPELRRPGCPGRRERRWTGPVAISAAGSASGSHRRHPPPAACFIDNVFGSPVL